MSPPELDPESGLYYYGGRYYDPELGRFISPDPFVPQPDDPQNLNRYSYVVNNPVNYIDPDGYKKKKKGGFFRSFFGKLLVSIFAAAIAAPIAALATTTTMVAMAGSSLTISSLQTAISVGALVGKVAGGIASGAAMAALSGGNVGIGALTGGASAFAGTLDGFGGGLGGGGPPVVSCFVAGPMCGGFSPVLAFNDPGGTGSTGIDKRKAHDISIIGLGDFGDIGLFDILAVGSVGAAKTSIAGIYKVFSNLKWYVGQSKHIATRLMQHLRAGKFTLEEVEKAVIERVPGGRTAREVAEQLEIDKLGGIKGGNVSNQRNPIGPNRRDLLED
ncbi:MAG: hypothetical protein HY694_01725 [Deltaproteobacteria bacterium]|nr:hypothetical protein [Deltaproteobacteria bacterium]